MKRKHIFHSGCCIKFFFFFLSGEIFAFNVEAPASIRKMAASCNVPLRIHNVIYHLFDELRDSMSARLPILVEDDVVGELIVCLSQKQHQSLRALVSLLSGYREWHTSQQGRRLVASPSVMSSLLGFFKPRTHTAVTAPLFFGTTKCFEAGFIQQDTLGCFPLCHEQSAWLLRTKDTYCCD